ncbi:MAG: adenine deaminase [Spirochaetaceae bacterium]|nr:MAG: adenine deaminase [Spirochaetaceae bacterium]
MLDKTIDGLVATQAEVASAVAVAAGRARASLLLRNARIVNVITNEITRGSIAIAGRLIAGVGETYDDADTVESVDLGGAHVCPGLIDGHVHIESSLVRPAAYANAVVPRGVTGVVWDPHEIANVAGIAGIEWCIQSSSGLPLSIWIDAPSCVPSTRLETAGARIGVPEIARLLGHPAVVGVGELMSYAALIDGDDDTLARAYLGQLHRTTVNGHAPGVTGRGVQAYLAAGVGSDHECTELDEAREKLRAGVFLMMREGSATRNLKTLLPLLTAETADRVGFVTDDRLPADLIRDGGVDHLVRIAIASGVSPATAIRAASWNTARYYSLNRRGAIAPGYFADLIVLESIETFSAGAVYHSGVLVARNGTLVRDVVSPVVDAELLTAVRDSVRVSPDAATRFRLPATSATTTVRCIRPIPDQILTTEDRAEATVRDGEIVADPSRDIAKLVCLERHGSNGNVGVGLVTGFGLRRGAIAGTVAHDHHNIMAAGIADADLELAVGRLAEIGGGFVVVDRGHVVAELALPIAGLLSEESIATVDIAMQKLDAAARDLGVTMSAPFMTLSFLGLPVIPELRLTDHGLIDVRAGGVVPVVVE